MQRIEDRFARVLLDYSLGIKTGDRLCIRGGIAALPLIRAAYGYALRRGAFPQIQIHDEAAKDLLIQSGSRDQLQYVPASEYTVVRDCTALLNILGSENVKSLSNADPERIKQHTLGRSRYLKIFYDRFAKKQVRFCITQYPTQADAQEAAMSLDEYAAFVYGSCMLDKKDPVPAWKRVSATQEKICAKLDKKKNLHIVSKDTDLRLSVEGRKWINCDGKENFPDGEVFTGPVEHSVNGHIRFSFPAIYAGREVEDIRLVFKNGRVVEASAARGEDLLVKLLDTDPGARYLGEVAVGTNHNIRKFTKNILFDEKIGGTVHCAIGRSFPESKAKNRSAIHWDMLCDMKQEGKIFADGTLIYEKGRFLI